MAMAIELQSLLQEIQILTERRRSNLQEGQIKETEDGGDHEVTQQVLSVM
jgi:hypothetical protein